MWEFFAVGVGGFIGSCIRFAITKLAANYHFFPFGTLISNVIAGLLIGFIVGLEQKAVVFPARARLLLTAGLLGGLSTFSTFSMETVDLFQNGKYILATGNIALNLGLSISGVLVGMFAAKAVA